MAEELYLEPSRKAQVILLLVLISGGLVAASIGPLIDYLTPSKSATLEELESGGRSVMLVLMATFFVCVILSLIWASYFLRLGYRALQSGSFPPPGAVVVARTRVRTGRVALISGWLSIAFGAFIFIPAVLIGYLLWLIGSAL